MCLLKRKEGEKTMSNIKKTKNKEERAKSFMKMFMQLQPENQQKIEDVQIGMLLAQSAEQKNIVKLNLKSN